MLENLNPKHRNLQRSVPIAVPWHRAPETTLCPLGQPEKAIDHESLLEPWLAPINRLACQFQIPNGFVNRRGMKPLGWKNQIDLPCRTTNRISGARGQIKSFLRYVGWRVRKYPAVGEVFFLTSPLLNSSGLG